MWVYVKMDLTTYDRIQYLIEKDIRDRGGAKERMTKIRRNRGIKPSKIPRRGIEINMEVIQPIDIIANMPPPEIDFNIESDNN
jgi:hypothetical protein